MTSPTCPICHAVLVPHADACPSCHAKRTRRLGMTPRGFTAFASLWLLGSAVLMLLALRIALAPWLPSGTAPDYALALLGAREAAEPPGCRVTVRDAHGRQIQSIVAASCAAADGAVGKETTPRRTPAEQASAAQRRVASALHSALALGIGVLLSVALRKALRRVFSRAPVATSWTLRAGT